MEKRFAGKKGYSRFRYWSEAPATLGRGWVQLGYMLYALLALWLVIFGAPSLDQTTFDGYTRDLGTVEFLLTIAAMYGAVVHVRYRIEMAATLLMASGYASYVAAAFATLINRGILGEGRVAFTQVVFIVTALLWARGLWLLLGEWIPALINRHVKVKGE